MKTNRIYTFITFILVFVVFLSFMGSYKLGALTTDPILVKDIREGTNDSFIYYFTNLNGTLYFNAQSNDNYGIFKSDGTEAGTVFVSSTVPDEERIVVNDTQLFFTGYINTYGNEFWKLDSTTDSVSLIKDIRPGVSSSSPGNLTLLGNTIFFFATNGTNGVELWKSDGTESGTIMVKDIYTGSSNSNPNYLTVFNNSLYFRATDSINGTELWKTDGTEAGTVLVKDINPAGNSSPSYLTVMGNTLFFSATNGTNGIELWKSDGTEAGTVMVKDINPGLGSSSPNVWDYSSLKIIGDTLYFAANDGTNGEELWKSDGTEAGTSLVKDIRPGLSGSGPWNFANLNGLLYFLANDGTNGNELWKSDGTTDGTVMVKDIESGLGSSYPEELIVFDNMLFFYANTQEYGEELWKSDGTEAGTVLVKDLVPGAGGSNSNVVDLFVLGDTLYFKAWTTGIGQELWKIDQIIPSPTPTPTNTPTPSPTVGLKITNINAIEVLTNVFKYYYSGNTNIKFKGVTHPLAFVRIVVNSDPKICETTADSEGNFECTFAYIENGLHTVTITATTVGGEVFTYPEITLGINVALAETGNTVIESPLVGLSLIGIGLIVMNIEKLNRGKKFTY